MKIKQISVFMENKKGRLAEITKTLSLNNIDIKALSMADATDFGVLRIIVKEHDRGLAILKDNGFIAQETSVIAIEVEDRPGGLGKVLTILSENNINVEYMYAFVEKTKNNAIVIFKIDEEENAIKVLQQNNIPIVSNEVLKNL